MFIGLDLSLTRTGMVTLENDYNFESKIITTNSDQKIEDRILNIWNTIEQEMKDADPITEINIEGLSYGSRSSSVAELAGLHYFIRCNLFGRRNYIITPPTQLKKYVIGKAKSKKDLMLLYVYKKFGIEFDDDNLADAYSLARYSFEKFFER